MSGTILNYSSWLQQVGSNTVAPAQRNGEIGGLRGREGKWRGWVGGGVGVVGGLICGAWMVVF
jgi:hypothetical protein